MEIIYIIIIVSIFILLGSVGVGLKTNYASIPLGGLLFVVVLIIILANTIWK